MRRKAKKMSNATMIGLSQQMALRKTMDVIANNLANASTNGFKSESVLFQEYLADIEDEDGNSSTMSYVVDNGVSRDLKEGNLLITNNTFDVAIKGDGYFTIQTDDGDRYTRNGNFTLNAQGQLSTAQGNAVLDDGGAPITLGQDEGTIAILEDGTVTSELGTRGKIGVVEFDDESALVKVGNSLYQTDQAATPVDDPYVAQGSIEQSNVTPIVEMTKMIDVLRAYQAAGKLIETGEGLMVRAIRELGTSS